MKIFLLLLCFHVSQPQQKLYQNPDIYIGGAGNETVVPDASSTIYYDGTLPALQSQNQARQLNWI